MNRMFFVGLFTIGGLALFGAGLFLIGDRRQVFSRRIEYYTEFANLSQIAAGAKVVVAGMDAGEVAGVAIPDSPASKFRVRLRINEEFRGLIRADSVVTVGTEGVVGDRFLSVSAGSAQSPAAGPLSTLAGKDPIELSALLDQARDTMAHVDGTIQNANTVMTSANLLIGSAGGNLNVALVGARAAISNANDLIAGLKEGQGTAGMLLRDPLLADQVRTSVDNAQRASAGIQQVVEHANVLVADIQSKAFPDKIDDTLGEAKDTLANLKAASQNVRETAAQLAAEDERGLTAAVNLRQSLSSLNEAAGNIADDTEAIKHNFLLRGFFKKRGYYNLTRLAPAQYRNDRSFVARVHDRNWLPAADLFQLDSKGAEDITIAGKLLLDQAFAQNGARVFESAIVVEGYSDQGDSGCGCLSRKTGRYWSATIFKPSFGFRRATSAPSLSKTPPPQNSDRPAWNGVAIVFLAPN